MKQALIKTVVLLQDLEFGGTQRYAVNLLKHLDRQVFSPELWVLRSGEDMAPLARETGVTIRWLSHSSWVSPHSLFNLARKLREEKPDLLYTLTVVPNIWGNMLGRAVQVPGIVSGARNGTVRFMERFTYRLSTRIICNSQADRDTLVLNLSLNPDRITVIHNAVDTDYFTPDLSRIDEHPTAVFVGRLVEQKDPLVLLEAFRLVTREIPEARLIMIGNGHLKEPSEEFLRANGLEKNVTMLPGTRDIREHLRGDRIFVLPSRYEGSPNVIIESMAMGLPVVATAVGGVPDLVVDGETGFLVDPSDPAMLVRCLSRLYADSGLRREMGRKARDRVLAFHSMENMARSTEKVFLEAVNETRPQS
jgi:glycosyltransferase involved in cell wall biosynthesis